MSLRRLPGQGQQSTVKLHNIDDLTAALGIQFSDEQLAAITAPLEPNVIIAGAGSGKTTVMAARVVWLVGTGAVRPEEVLGLTFTRKAAAELSGRVRHALQTAGVISPEGVDEAGEQLIVTYDAFAARLVSEHAPRLGIDADPTMISGATRYRLASQVVNAAAGPFEHLSRLKPGTVTERVLKLDSDLQQHLVDPTRLDGHARQLTMDLQSTPLNRYGNIYADVRNAMVAAAERLELASLVVEYQKFKRRLGRVEFADQMAIAARLAIEAPEVSAAFRSSFKVVLLDEYQDTSAAQAIMLRGLFSGRTPDRGLGHPVTAVGDPFQAIYGWRGAAASNIVQFATEFRTASGKPSQHFTLSVNRRSGPTILAAANEVSESLRSSMSVALATPVADGSPPGRLPTASETDALGLLYAPPSTAPGTVRAATFATWAEEVSFIADQVVAAHEGGVANRWADIAILVRRNADIGPLYAELCSREVPVEIVGLGGLLFLPEVLDVTATLALLDDVTANPELVRLLSGPRWQIGPRDLALLGGRAQELARQHRGGLASDVGAERPAELPSERPAFPPTGETAMLTALEGAVGDVDPADVVCLLDAVVNPGDIAISATARARLSELAAEFAVLRRHSDDPLLDLTRRVIATLGLEVELMATPELLRTSRRDQLGAFVDAASDYVDVDTEASLSGLLAYLRAEREQGNGLDQVVPSDREAVKLLTVHKAKGLEWEVVMLPALVHGVFPSDRVTDNWVTNAAALPADLRGDASSVPQLAGASPADMAAYKDELKAAQLLAEDRLGYVAITRAKQLLVGTGHWWRADLVKPRFASTYLRAMMAEAERQGELVAQADAPGTQNPLVTNREPVTWPQPLEPEAWRLRRVAATQVSQAQQHFRDTGTYDLPGSPRDDPLLDTQEIIAGWDRDIDHLLAEAEELRRGKRDVRLPISLSATDIQRLNSDPQAFAAELARPMPRAPSRAARHGTRFHQWVERYFTGGSPGVQPLFDPDDLTDRADRDLDIGERGETDLRELREAFAAGQFGSTTPYAIEAPVSLLIAGRLVRGRIDAVYQLTGEHRFQVVDWKTSRSQPGDELQLGIYRLAWAEVCQLPIDEIDAAFYYVRSDRLIRPGALPDRTEIERLLLAEAP